MAAVDLRGITKAFGEVAVLRDVSLAIGDGRFVSLLGPSGCGKTTLLRIIAGLEAQDAGDVMIGGRLVDNLPPKARDVAMVFQSYALYPYMTVAENVALPLVMRRLTRAQRLPVAGRFMPGGAAARAAIAADVRGVCEGLGLAHLLGRRPVQLSGGQRQRVALARAMVRRPEVFLMDEPLSNLDAKLRVRARAEIADLHRRLGATFVYVTHDQTEAMTMSDEVAVMIDGCVLQVAPPQALYDDPAALAVASFIGTPEINVLAGVVRGDRGVDVAGRPWPAALAAPAGTSVQVGVRPEAWLVDARPFERGAARPSAAAFSVVVRNLEQLGPETLVHGAADGVSQLLVARVDPASGATLRIGQALAFVPRPGRALYFAAGGERLRERGAPILREAVHV